MIKTRKSTTRAGVWWRGPQPSPYKSRWERCGKLSGMRIHKWCRCRHTVQGTRTNQMNPLKELACKTHEHGYGLSMGKVLCARGWTWMPVSTIRKGWVCGVHCRPLLCVGRPGNNLKCTNKVPVPAGHGWTVPVPAGRGWTWRAWRQPCRQRERRADEGVVQAPSDPTPTTHFSLK